MSTDADTTDSDDAVRAEVVAISDDWATAIASNDAERIASFMADDWVIVSESGVSSKDQFLSFIKSGELTPLGDGPCRRGQGPGVRGCHGPHVSADQHRALPRPALRRRRVDDGRIREARRSLAVRAKPHHRCRQVRRLTALGARRQDRRLTT